jgi:hypothetical protein
VKWLIDIFVLLDIHPLVFDQDDGALVFVRITIVWRRKHSDHGGEGGGTTPSVHFVPVNLHLMSSDDRQKIILFKYLLEGIEAELVRTFSLHIFDILLSPSILVSGGV